MTEPILDVRGLSVTIGDKRIVHDVSFTVNVGGFTALMGPNGSGKTTCLRAIYGALPPTGGAVTLMGEDALAMRPGVRARKVAVLRQEPRMDFEFLVHEVVAMGRSPHKRLLEPDGVDDRRIVEEALRLTDAAHLEHRTFVTLSGGEKQRVLLARAIAQEPKLLILDEPTNHLDLSHQLAIMRCVRELGVSVLAALHDPNLALRFADRAVILDDGARAAEGPVDDVLVPDVLGPVFGVTAERVRRSNGEAMLAFD